MPPRETLAVTRDGDGLPATDVLTGRGFVTGKSGSGKSNTATVLAEELLDADLPLLVVDTEGEYYGLRESYDLLHVGSGRHVDAEIGPAHADRLAHLALGENVPVVLDVSGYRDPDRAHETVGAVVDALFTAEYEYRKPFLLLVEELHEYLPQSGGRDEVAETLLRVAKRGRKRGLGLCGLSQRPAAVDKDFVTQCDWLVWHRLTWATDTDVVARLLGSEAAETVTDLDDGEALLVADWFDERQRVQVRRKRTFDAGATPDLDDTDRPELRSVDASLVAELDSFEGDEQNPSESGASTGDDADTESDTATGAESRSGTTASDGERRPADAGGTGDPVWELGQLTAHLLAAGGRRAARTSRRFARGTAATARSLRGEESATADDDLRRRSAE